MIEYEPPKYYIRPGGLRVPIYERKGIQPYWGETNKFRVCSFGPSQHALEQLFNDGRWYQRGRFFETKREVEIYGRELIGESAELVAPIGRGLDGKELPAA